MKKILLLISFSLFAFSMVFAEISIEDALQNSLKNSLEFRQIVLDRDAQNKALLASLPDILPYISLTVSADTSDYSDWSYSNGLNISQNIFNLPAFINIYKNKEYADIANNVYIKGKYTLINNIIDKFFSLLEYQIKIDIDTLLIKREDENVKKGEISYRSGFLSETEYLTLQSNYFTILYSYQNDLYAYESLLNDFKTLTGIDSQERLSQTESVPVFDSLDFNGEDILKSVPEYVISKKTYDISKADEASSYTEFLPKASLSAGYKTTNSDLNLDYQSFIDSASFHAGISVSFPVFTGLSRTVNIIDKGYARKSKMIDMLKIKESLLLEINNLKRTISQTGNLYESALKGYSSSKIVFDKSEKLFNAGELSTSEYITYQKTYMESAINLIKAKKEAYKLYYRTSYLLRRI